MDNGDRVEDFDKVRPQFIHHFKSFMGTASFVSRRLDIKFIAQGPALDLDQQLILVKPFSEINNKYID